MLVANKVNVPSPSLVNVPVLVVIGSATVVLPAPPKVKLNVPESTFPLATSKVNVPESEFILEAEA